MLGCHHVVRQRARGYLLLCVRCLSVPSLSAKLCSLVVASHVTYRLVYVYRLHHGVACAEIDYDP